MSDELAVEPVELGSTEWFPVGKVANLDLNIANQWDEEAQALNVQGKSEYNWDFENPENTKMRVTYAYFGPEPMPEGVREQVAALIETNNKVVNETEAFTPDDV